MKLLDKNFDILTADVKYKDTLHSPKQNKFAFMNDAWSFVSCHSVGCVFRKDLHKKFGYYSKRFPIAADQYFIKEAVYGGAKVHYEKFLAGEFGSTGISSTDTQGHLCETFRVQYETEKNKTLQFALFVLRLIKNKVLGKF
jgi:hypothetical protein